MIWRWMLLFSFLMLVFSVIQLPTRFVLQILPVLPMVSFSQATGTVWHGGVCAHTPMISDAVCVDWQWQASRVLDGQMGWSYAAKIGSVEATGQALVSSVSWQLKGVLAVQQGQVMPQWAAWLPVGDSPSEKRLDYSGALP